MPKPFKVLPIMGCLGLAAIGGVLPVVGWIFFVLALHVLVSEFETGRDWVKGARRRCLFCRAGSSRRGTIPGRHRTCIASTT